MINEELINILQSRPKDAEVMIVVGDAEDYVPIRLVGYAKNFNMVLVEPEDRDAFLYIRNRIK